MTDDDKIKFKSIKDWNMKSGDDGWKLIYDEKARQITTVSCF